MAPKLTLREKTFIVFAYGKSENISEVQRQYQVEFQKKPPQRISISKLISKFKATGSVEEKGKSGKFAISYSNYQSIGSSLAFNLSLGSYKQQE